jgi:predicted nucleotidyltransferase
MGLSIVDLIGENRDEIIRIALRYGASNVRVFGSAARGEAKPDSDIDLLVTFEKKHSLLDRVALKQDIEDLLGRKADVVTEKTLDEAIRNDVLRDAVPL